MRRMLDSIVTFVGAYRRVALAALLAAALAGCGGTALRQSFNDYSTIYAGVTNRQLLLNLARAANSHPPHFLQLGLINTSFTFASNASASAGNVATEGVPPASPTASGPFRFLSRVFTLGGSIGGAVSETPTFSLTPLSGPQFAQGFLAAVSPQVFFTLLEQGKRVDQLLRVLVHAVEFADADGQTVAVLNTPTAERHESWVQFLRLAGILAELQRRHLLEVATTAVQVPGAGPVFESPTLEDALKAAEKGMSLKEVSPGKYTLSTVAATTSLKILPGAEAVFEEMARDPYFQIKAFVPRPHGGRPPAAKMKTPDSMTLRLRSFFTAMTWTSTEQQVFDRLAGRPGFLDSIPPSQRQPVLRLLWDGTKPEELEPPLATVDYGEKTYAIVDPHGKTWNRDVFTLLSFVHSQVSLDPKSLPIQQLINVR